MKTIQSKHFYYLNTDVVHKNCNITTKRTIFEKCSTFKTLEVKKVDFQKKLTEL